MNMVARAVRQIKGHMALRVRKDRKKGGLNGTRECVIFKIYCLEEIVEIAII